MNKKFIEIIQPDDWHIHLREGAILNVVKKFSSRINNRCIVMPNLKIPITTSALAKKYIHEIQLKNTIESFKPLIPCYLTENLNLKDFEDALKQGVFIGAKLYPNNATTNSNYGVKNIEKIYPALEILDKYNKHLLIHGEKISDEIDIFDREKYFIDDELTKIINYFPNLRIILEHVSSKYGSDFILENNNIAGTITPQHMLITKKDVFDKDIINAHNFCMPVAKNEEDLLALRKSACSGNKKFFLGTDSAPHLVKDKNNENPKPGIFSSPCSLELYTEIFEQENSLDNLEAFTSINGPLFYNLPINKKKIKLIKEKWIQDDYTEENGIKIKNFFGGKEINWKVLQ